MVMVGVLMFSWCVDCLMLIRGEWRLCFMLMLSVLSGEM